MPPGAPDARCRLEGRQAGLRRPSGTGQDGWGVPKVTQQGCTIREGRCSHPSPLPDQDPPQAKLPEGALCPCQGRQAATPVFEERGQPSAQAPMNCSLSSYCLCSEADLGKGR